jgi:hypothetical protein
VTERRDCSLSRKATLGASRSRRSLPGVSGRTCGPRGTSGKGQPARSQGGTARGPTDASAEPFLGTTATAPLLEAALTTPPGRFGGNMTATRPPRQHRAAADRDRRRSTLCRRRAREPGRRRALRCRAGDHCPVSCVQIEPGQVIPAPHIGPPTQIMCVGSGRPLGRPAARRGLLIAIIRQGYGLSRSGRTSS